MIFFWENFLFAAASRLKAKKDFPTFRGRFQAGSRTNDDVKGERQIAVNRLNGIASRGHGNTTSGMASRSAQIHIANRCFVTAHLRDRSHCAHLGRAEEGTVGDRAVGGTRQQGFKIQWAVHHAARDVVSQIGNIVFGQLVDETIRKRFLDLLPVSAGAGK